MCTVYWEIKGILLVEFLPRGETINAEYCEIQGVRAKHIKKELTYMRYGNVLLFLNSYANMNVINTEPPRLLSYLVKFNVITISPFHEVQLVINLPPCVCERCWMPALSSHLQRQSCALVPVNFVLLPGTQELVGQERRCHSKPLIRTQLGAV